MWIKREYSLGFRFWALCEMAISHEIETQLGSHSSSSYPSLVNLVVRSWILSLSISLLGTVMWLPQSGLNNGTWISLDHWRLRLLLPVVQGGVKLEINEVEESGERERVDEIMMRLMMWKVEGDRKELARAFLKGRTRGPNSGRMLLREGENRPANSAIQIKTRDAECHLLVWWGKLVPSNKEIPAHVMVNESHRQNV